MLTRRGFLQVFASAAGASAFDPERLLWIPGEKAYFDIIRPRVAAAPFVQAGLTSDWLDEFVARNPYDASRMGAALDRKIEQIVYQELYARA